MAVAAQQANRPASADAPARPPPACQSRAEVEPAQVRAAGGVAETPAQGADAAVCAVVVQFFTLTGSGGARERMRLEQAWHRHGTRRRARDVAQAWVATATADQG